MKIIVESFTDKGDANGQKFVQTNSFKVEGQKYMCLRSTDEHLYGRLVRSAILS